MKKISKWAIAIGTFGFLFSVGTMFRYFVIWIDHDKGLVYGLIGVMIMAFAWVYNEILKLRIENDALSEAMHEHLNNKTEKRETKEEM